MSDVLSILCPARPGKVVLALACLLFLPALPGEAQDYLVGIRSGTSLDQHPG